MTRNEIAARRQQNLLRQEYLKLFKPTLPPMNFLINKVRYEHIVSSYDYRLDEYRNIMRQLNMINGVTEGDK